MYLFGSFLWRWPLEEFFMPIEGFDQYQVSNFGDVKSFKSAKNGKLLKQKITREGYREVTLYSDSKPAKYLVHRLVLNAFRFVPLKGKHKIKHLDHDPGNNKLSNLCFGDNAQSTDQNAMADAIVNVAHDAGSGEFVFGEDEIVFI